jgi:hypothetical protein
MAREDSETSTKRIPMIRKMTVKEATAVIKEKIKSTGFFFLIVIAMYGALFYYPQHISKKWGRLKPAPEL